MFIELSEYLLCPGDHERSYCVVVPDEMVGRLIRTGVIGCPICKREFPIEDGVARMGDRPATSQDASWTQDSADGKLPDPRALQVLMGLTNPGGYVVLVGTAAGMAAGLSALLGGVHFVVVNAPRDLEGAPFLSRVEGADRIPLRDSMARAVVVGRESAVDPWLKESVRVLLRGQRLVSLAEVSPPTGVKELAVGQGLWVGEKT